MRTTGTKRTCLRALQYLPAAFALALSACQGGLPEEMATATELAPMARPEINVGDKRYSLKDGETEVVTTAVAVNDDGVKFSSSLGCEWTEIGWGFAPSTQWSNCSPWKDGTQKITATRGDLWPLKVGNEVSYDLTGTDTGGDSWKTTRNCKVEKQARITTVSGEYDTFKVVCRDEWTNRTWYMSPDAKTDVEFVRTRKRQNQTNKWEFMKFEAAPSS